MRHRCKFLVNFLILEENNTCKIVTATYVSQKLCKKMQKFVEYLQI